jgi:hypothetical protein
MTLATPTIVPLFATPFAVVPVGIPAQLQAALARLFLGRTTDEWRDPSAPRDELCFRSREDLFEWTEEPVAQLKREMLSGACAAVMAVNSYPEAEFDALRLQARARFVIVRPNGCLPAATAPMASWCALCCVAAPPPAPARADSASLRLYAVRDAAMFIDAANWRLRNPYSGAHQVWRPVPGQMAVFPAGILHEVALNRSTAELVLVAARLRFCRSDQPLVLPW